VVGEEDRHVDEVTWLGAGDEPGDLSRPHDWRPSEEPERQPQRGSTSPGCRRNGGTGLAYRWPLGTACGRLTTYRRFSPASGRI
jgi:hypothetical protein